MNRISFFQNARRQFAKLAFTGVSFLLISLFPDVSFAVEVTTESLKETEAKIQDLARKTTPATVALIPGTRTRRFGSGSGVVVNEGGLILTAAHVLMGMNNQVTVIFPDGKRAKGKVLGMDYTRDAGMVQITDPGKYSFAEIGDTKSLKKNDWCVALGHAGGYQPQRSPPARLGRVIVNNSKKYLMTDSALISGDSGGPLFDINGKVIGIHSNIGVSLSQNNHVPISAFLDNWDQLKSGKRFGGDEEGALLANPDRPMIGATLVDDPNHKGALIDEVTPQSPAAKAGLKTGDRIIKADDKEIKDSFSLISAIRKRKVGDVIKMKVDSKGKPRDVSVTLMSARRLNNSPADPRSLQRANSPRSPEKTKELQKEFDKKMRESIEEGKLKLSESDYQKFRNPADFNRFLERFMKSLSAAEKKKLDRIASPPRPKPIRPGTYDPDKPFAVGEVFFREVLDAFRPSAAKASRATHHVFRGQEWKSLCTVVHEAGYAVTKASEIETENNQKLNVLLAKGKLVPATVAKTFPKYDLALLKLKDTSGLTPVDLDGPVRDLPVGSMLSAPGSGPDPVAIGLVSVKPRSLSGENKGFLGIGTAPHEKGVQVTMVLSNASAGRAGVKKGDIITRINDANCDTPEKLIKQISSQSPGTKVTLHFLRNGKKSSLEVKLGNRKELDENIPDPSGKMNRMGTKVNTRRSNFPRALQTDLPILPSQCGGPLVDLEGNVIGINIARAGRIKTYAIPAREVWKLIEPELAKIPAKAPVKF